ncbi:6919_t:CDS:2 [Funneliformis geosporum]|uniref:6855_t:CDS:1 n=1 Tax=Funneliformis geosporum TaxID=1117311 RepID=A0A9W4SC14_9GLOM|nr:6919_t:CDS:2 [Funneliformis geosporum]CAI2163555.1 6855_t:CDS:2 [Funneliformis geosporum]
MKIIDHRRKEIEDHKELGSDMLTLLITAHTEQTEQIDEEHSKPLTNDQIFHILIEAIAHYPNVLARLREELDTIFGSEKNRQITMEDLSKMRYTEAIIKECSRLINASKMTQRNSSSPDTMIDREWPANTAFIVYMEGIHHNPIHWKNPLKFNPDRFMEADPQKNTFLMFGGGVRICPGRKLALVAIKVLISLIYRNLDISLVDMDAPLKLKNTIVNACSELNIRVKQRE